MIPTGNYLFHSIIPLQDLCSLLHHHLYLLLSERNGPRQRGQCIAGNIERQQLPEKHGNLIIKISIYHTGGESGRDLSTPHDTIKLLPGIPLIIQVKNNDLQLSLAVDHHIPHMVIPVLVGLWTIL